MNRFIGMHLFTVSVYSAIHLVVDLACAFLVFSVVLHAPEGYLCLLLYNFCAFALQMPFGVIADKLGKNHLVAGVGCLLVIAGFALSAIPAAAAAVVGIGNALFHIGGGIDVLNISKGRTSALGVFVAPGALGVYLGTLLGQGESASSLPILVALAFGAGLILSLCLVQKKQHLENAQFSLENPGVPSLPLVAVCLLFVVCLRSFVGLTLDFPWKNAVYGAVLVGAVVCGKALGGIASDRIGIKRCALASLGCAAVLFCFSGFPTVGIVAVLLFNMTMPITLGALAKAFPGAKGFSFGLLSFGLFLGFLPVYFGGIPMPTALWHFALFAAVSLLLLWTGLALLRKAKP